MGTQSDQQPERRATSVSLTVHQLAWARNQAVQQRIPMTRVVENALVAAGAPSAEEPTAEGEATNAGA